MAQGWGYSPKDATLGLPDGTYSAVISKVEDTQSKKGDPMRVITFTVYDGNDETTLKDYYVQGNRIAIYRMKQLAVALGQALRFGDGAFDAQDHLGESLDLELTTDDRGYNKIAAYAPSSRAGFKAPAGPPTDEDDLAF